MARVISFEGRQISVPDDASDDDVAGILSATPAATPAAPTAPSAADLSGVPTPPGATRLTVSAAPPVAAPTPQPGFGRSLKVGVQGVGAGLADVAGMPVDLATGGINIAAGLGDMLLGPRTQQSLDPMAAGSPGGPVLGSIQHPFGGSESIKNAASSVANLFGVDTIPESGMNGQQKLGYNIDRFGTQGIVNGAALAKSGIRAGTDVATTALGRVFDTMRQQYAAAPARTAIGDAGAGAGAGWGINTVDNYVPKDSPFRPIADIFAALIGGIGGAGSIGAAEGVGNAARSVRNKYTADPNVPKGANGQPFNMAETERAARSFQNSATNPATAAKEIRDNKFDLTGETIPDTARSTASMLERYVDPYLYGKEQKPNVTLPFGEPPKAGVQPGERPLSRGELPTSGLLSRDPGLVNAETGARTRNNPPFIQRDQQVKSAAAERVESLRDPTADLNAPRAIAQQEADTRMGAARTAADTGVRTAETRATDTLARARTAAENAVQQAQADLQAGITGAQGRLTAAEQALRDVEAEATRQGAPIAAVANSDAKAQASQRLDNTIVNEGYIPARTEKNRQFDEAPGRHDQLPADEVIQAARAVQRGISDLAPGGLQMPGEFVQRLRALEPRMVEGENVGGPGTALGADLADLRKYLGTAQESAQRSGNFDLSDNIARLRRAINNTIEDAPGYAEANANYGQFADRYRPSPNDEAAKFTRQIDRDPARGTTKPSETAGRFLSGPEKAQSLQRMMDGTNGPAAVRDYMLSDFGMSAMNPNGTINPNRAAAWGRNNADVLAQFPQLRNEFDGMLATARRGEELSATATANIDNARRNLADTERQGTSTVRDVERAGTRGVRQIEQQGRRNVRDAERTGQEAVRNTEREINNSAAGTLLKADPRDVAQRLLGTKKYGADSEIDGINKLIGSDPAAKRGWKAAVSEVLSDRVTSTRQTGETYEIQYGRLAKEFKDNEQILAKTFDPEEMNTLRQAHTLLGYFKEAEKRATSGSQTASNMQIPGWLQLAARHVYGDLRGGGVIKRFKLLMEVLPSNRAAAEEVANMAWFNPDVAAYLLERPIRNYDAAPYNVNLKRLEALAAGSRDASSDEK